MKNLLNLQGIKVLNKREQQSVNGGYEDECGEGEECPQGYLCYIPQYVCKTEEWCSQNTNTSTYWSCY